MYGEKQLKLARAIVNATWILAVACFFFPLYDMGVGSFGRTLFWLLACVHLVEFPLFLKIYRETGEPLLGHFLRHMAYGVIHRAEVLQRAGGAPDPEAG